MKALLYSRYGSYPQEIEELVKNTGLEIVTENPELVVTYGGDGTLLGAERDYPGIPKLPLRNSQICHHCIPLPNEKILELFSQNMLTIKEFSKLEAIVGSEKILALNEFSLRNSLVNSALRFKLAVTPATYLPPEVPDILVGDGLVIATPFGSTGYFQSITKHSFTAGIGLAFNNLHQVNIRKLFLPDNATLKVTLNRGPADLSADNNPEVRRITDGAEIEIRLAIEKAHIYSLA